MLFVALIIVLTLSTVVKKRLDERTELNWTEPNRTELN